MSECARVVHAAVRTGRTRSNSHKLLRTYRYCCEGEKGQEIEQARSVQDERLKRLAKGSTEELSYC